MDPGPLAALDADIAAAAAAVQASQAEARRARGLYGADATVSRKTAEAAEAMARADAAKLTLLRRRVGLEWGSALSRLSDAQRGALVANLASGRSALVRIDAATGFGQVPPPSLEIDLGRLGAAHARVLGFARTSDARMAGAGLIALVSGPQAAAMPAGLTATARVAVARAQPGVMIPRTALIRAEGKTWAYVRRSATDFERRPVIGATPDPDGLFAPQGFRANEPVVVSGASALLAAERGAAEPEGE
jgi:hypothetical protein